MMRNKMVVSLLAAFILSALIRLPNLNRPLSKHHEFCTAVALRIITIWDEAGIETYQYNPVMTYPNHADKFINNYATASGEMIDKAGNYYYVSHPPLAYYVPYFIFKLVGVKPGVWAIQLFHLLVHFVCGIGVYSIARDLFPVSGGKFSIGAFIAYLFYLFSPGTLWFQSNTYMSDMFVQLFFVFGIYVALKVFQKNTLKNITTLGALIFLMIYTSWLGLFFAFTVFILAIYKIRKNKFGLTLVAAILVSTISALALFIYQYSQINGWEAYYHEAFSRFLVRSSANKNIDSLVRSLAGISKNYMTSYLPILLLLGFLFIKEKGQFKKIKTLALPVRKTPDSFGAGRRYFIFVSVVPILLMHLILTDYSGHDFTTLYGAVALCVMAGILISGLGKKEQTGIAGIVLILCVGQYYYINRPGEISWKGDSYNEMMDRGLFIKDHSSQDEVLFMTGKRPSPEEVYYANRNILFVQSASEAEKFLKKMNQTKGIVFHVNAKGVIKITVSKSQ